MKQLLTIISCFLALTLTAQEVVIEYPYNPDFENDGNVGVEDLLELLSSFGMAFEVGELTIDEVALSEWLQAISETLIAQQAMIDSLSSVEPTVMEFDSSWFNNSLNASNGSITRDWPLGHHGRVINHGFYNGPFNVPEDSVLFVTYGPSVDIYGESVELWTVIMEHVDANHRPCPLPPGTMIGGNDTEWFTGILVEDQPGFQAILWDFSMGSFIVPNEKLLIPRWTDGDWGQLITGFLNSPVFLGNAASWTQDLTFSAGTELIDNNNAGGMIGYLVDEDYFESSSPSSSPEVENIGLAFGEMDFYPLETLEWYQEYPENANSNSVVAHVNFDADGFCRITGFTNACPVKSAIVPDSINGPFTGDILEADFSESYFEGYTDFTIPLPKSKQLIIINEFGLCENQSIQWTPLATSSSSINNDESGDEPTTENVFEVDFEDFDLALIPTSCSHLIVNPPAQLPLWEVNGYGPSGFTQLYAVPHESVIDTIAQVGLYNVTEIQGYPDIIEIDLDHFLSDEILIEWGDTFDWYSQILPSMEFFQSALGDDDWESGNIAISTPRLICDQSYDQLNSWSICLVTQNVDFSTVNGFSYDPMFDFDSESHIGNFRKTAGGFWFKSWGWQN